MLTKAADVMAYVKSSAGRSSLHVIFEDQNHPRHDGSTIYLPKVTIKTSEQDLIDMMASTDHEVAHDRYSDFGILKEKSIDPSSSPLGYIWNVLEDSRVNTIEAQEYEGFKELWEKSTPPLLKKILKEMEPSPMMTILCGMIRWDGEVCKDTFPLCSEAASKFPENEKLEKVLTPFSDRLVECQKTLGKVEGSKKTYNLARDIFKALGGDPDEEEKKAKERKEVAGKTKVKSETEGGKEETRDEEEGKAKKVKALEGDKDDKSKEDDWKLLEVKPSDVEALLTKHDVLERMSKVGLVYEVDHTLEGWTLTPFNEFAVVDFHKQTHNIAGKYIAANIFDANADGRRFYVDSYQKRVVPNLITVDNFAQKVRQEIQIRSRVRYEYGVKKGKLDQARLSRIVTGIPGYSENVFKNKVSSTVLDAAISVLIDMSGSMSGDKVLYAGAAAALVNQVCKVLQIPLEIAGFTDTHLGATVVPFHFIYKPFAQQSVTEEELLGRIGASTTSMSGNPDGENILYAYNNLLKRKEKKRCLIEIGRAHV